MIRICVHHRLERPGLVHCNSLASTLLCPSRLTKQYGSDIVAIEKPKFTHPCFFGYTTFRRKPFDIQTTNPLFAGQLSCQVSGNPRHYYCQETAALVIPSLVFVLH